MTTTSTSAATTVRSSSIATPLSGTSGVGTLRPAAADRSAELRQHFTQFVGEAFFGQMLKAMRATVGKPAYFHGGRAEEVFQGQLDQRLAEHLTEASASKIAEPMFERQFPQFAERIERSSLDELSQLRRI